MKILKTVSLILIGFTLHKVVYEVANVRGVKRYNSCISDKIGKKIDRSPYQQCKDNLDYQKVEAFLLYQPNFWEKYSPFGE